MTRGVILQPSLAPWLGVFKLIADCDVFVHYDDVQYDKHGWRNRNRLDEGDQLSWITVPVRGSTTRLLNEVEIDWTGNWESKLRKRLANHWRRRPFGVETLGLVENALDRRPAQLTELTIPLTEEIAKVLCITPTRGFFKSSESGVEGSRNGRLVALLEAFGCDTYRSGPAAQDYLDEELFRQHGIAVEWEDYVFPRPAQPANQLASVLEHLSFNWTAAKAFIATPTEVQLGDQPC